MLIKGDEYTGELPSDAEVYIHSTVPNAYIDIASGLPYKNYYESSKTIKAKKVSDEEYAAIIVPQRLERRVPLFEVVAGGVSYLVESSFLFKMGVQHTVNIILSNNPDQVKIEIGGEIEGDWGTTR